MWGLFVTFFKIGLFTFGGGYAMISIVEDECVNKRKWISEDEMLNLIIIAESTPGPIAINCATYTGYKVKGFLGALVSTIAMALPSFIIIFLISTILDNFLEIKLISYAFTGIKVGVGFLIVDAGEMMAKSIDIKSFKALILAFSFIAIILINIFNLSISSIFILILGALFSFVYEVIIK